MDQYQSDSAGYEQGNMRSSANQSAYAGISQANGALQTAVLQQTGVLKANAMSALQQNAMTTTNALGSLGKRVENYKEWVAGNKLTRLSKDPVKELSANMTFEQKKAYHNPQAKPPERPRAEGTPASEDGSASTSHDVTMGEGDLGKGDSLFSKGLGAVGDLGEKAVKGLSVAADIGVGGVDLYNDIKNGNLGGGNGFDEAGNVLAIGSGLAETVGLVFPPAEIIGGVLGVLGGVASGIGDMFDSGDAKEKAKQQVTTTSSSVTVAPSSSVVATARAIPA